MSRSTDLQDRARRPAGGVLDKVVPAVLEPGPMGGTGTVGGRGAQTPSVGVPPTPTPGTGEPDPGPQTDRTQAELAERTADLQRVKAEYDNYRKRVQRDRIAVREIAVANVLTGLLPVLDALAQARDQGELTGGFASVAETLETRLAALGLRSFGEPGDPFDPVHHEAQLHALSSGVDRATCSKILRPGYQVGAHLLRPAQVAVTEPPATRGGDA